MHQALVLRWSERIAATGSAKDISKMVSSEKIVTLQDQLTQAWHEQSDADYDGATPVLADGTMDERKRQEDWLRLIASQHRANFDLWHIEDEARRPGATDAEVAQVKRRIDKTNQLRNDLIEEIDCALLSWLKSQGLLNAAAPPNSEPPGMIIDRLSILALKIYHTREEATRKDAPSGHATRNRERLEILEEQRTSLAECLDSLWQDILNGRRSFRVYRQLKMYNDPSLNPAIYGKTLAGHGR